MIPQSLVKAEVAKFNINTTYIHIELVDVSSSELSQNLGNNVIGSQIGPTVNLGKSPHN